MGEILGFLIFFAYCLYFFLLLNIPSMMRKYRISLLATEEHQRLVQAIERGELNYSTRRLKIDAFVYADELPRPILTLSDKSAPVWSEFRASAGG